MKPKYIINVHTHLRHYQNIEERIKLWRKCNVRKVCVACMVPRSPKHTYFTNEDLIPWMEQYPDILVGMGAINLSKNPDPPEKIEELKEQGFTGLKFTRPYYPYNHKVYFPLYEKAEKLGMPILFHTGWVAIGRDGLDVKYGVDSNNMRPYYFDKIARAFPRLKIIGAHLGKPHAHEALSMIKHFPNIYYDFSGGSGRKDHEMWVLRALSPMLGADMTDPAENPALEYFKKLCFATDNPEPPLWIEISNRIMDKLCIPRELREKFYWKNACGIFGWDESELCL